MTGVLTNTSVRDPAADHACGCCRPGHPCDGLECLCRPRFFAGQLLTDDDLRRLDHYIVAKNRLHNRYLHGTGSVCGLEVVCNPCDDTVTVRPGYALGPCGEDIVVCRDTAVDVGELIRAQRKQVLAADGEPYGARPVQDCDAARQRWILAICYDERSSRGVTSLRRPSTSCGCSCASCGDTANGGGADRYGNAYAHSKDACTCSPRTAPIPPQCEPTLTCEGYRFVLRKEPPPRVVGRAGALADSELGQRVQACLVDITTRMQQLGQTGGNVAALVELCCELKDNLRDIMETGNVHDCMLGARLNTIVCPDPNDANAQALALQAIQQLLLIAIELYKSCVCSALLPPCSVGSADDCIPLATLTIRSADLRVLDICNWSSRQFAITFPTLGYWLGWLPIFDTLRAAITRLCCAPVRPKFEFTNDLKVRYQAPGFAAAPQTAGQEAGASAVNEASKSTMTQLVAQYARNTTPLSGLEANVLAALGAMAEDGSALASDLELRDPFTALALTHLTGPALAPVVPDPVTSLFARLAQTGTPQDKTAEAQTPDAETPEGAAAPEDDRVTRLEASIARLERTVRNQARTIRNIRKESDK